MTHEQYQFLLFVVSNILESPENPKFRTLFTRNPVLTPEIREYLQTSLGFEPSATGDRIVLEDSQGQDLVAAREWLQNRVDETLDPENISFAKVAEILQRNGTLPGINHDIDDTPVGLTVPIPGNTLREQERPRKPWEIDS